MYLDIDRARETSLMLIQAEGYTVDKEEYVNELLEMSAATDSEDNIHYRVFLVAAILLSQDLDSQYLSEADDVVFTGYSKPIESMLGLQKSYDLSKDLDIPNGFTAQEYMDRLCGCNGSEGGFGGATIMSAFVV